MSHTTMNFQTKQSHSLPYNWRGVLIIIAVFILVGTGGWWGYQAGWLDRFLGQSTPITTISQSAASQAQGQAAVTAPQSSVTASTAASAATVAAKPTVTAKTTSHVATPAAAPVSIPVIGGVHGVQLWDANGKLLATLDSATLLAAKGRSPDSTWLAVQAAAGDGWVQTAQVVAYDVQTLPITALPASVVTAAQPAQATAVSATPVPPAVVQTNNVAGAASNPTASVTTLTATVSTTDRLNVRSGPGTDYTILTKANTGDTLTVIGRNATSDWLQIQLPSTPDSLGWVAAQYVTLAGDVNVLSASDQVSTAPVS